VLRSFFYGPRVSNDNPYFRIPDSNAQVPSDYRDAIRKQKTKACEWCGVSAGTTTWIRHRRHQISPRPIHVQRSPDNLQEASRYLQEGPAAHPPTLVSPNHPMRRQPVKKCGSTKHQKSQNRLALTQSASSLNSRQGVTTCLKVTATA